MFRSKQLQVAQGVGELGDILSPDLVFELVMLTASERLVQILSPNQPTALEQAFFHQD